MSFGSFLTLSTHFFFHQSQLDKDCSRLISNQDISRSMSDLSQTWQFQAGLTGNGFFLGDIYCWSWSRVTFSKRILTSKRSVDPERTWPFVHSVYVGRSPVGISAVEQQSSSSLSKFYFINPAPSHPHSPFLDQTRLEWASLWPALGRAGPPWDSFDCQQFCRHSYPHADFRPAWNRCGVEGWASFQLHYHPALRKEAVSGDTATETWLVYMYTIMKSWNEKNLYFALDYGQVFSIFSLLENTIYLPWFNFS